MKKLAGGQGCLIKTKRHYEIEELLESMRNGGLEEKFGTIELKKKKLIVQGEKKFVNSVVSVGKTIQISQDKEEGAGMKVVHHMTEGAFANLQAIGRMAGLGGAKENQKIMIALAEEIEKLVEVKKGGCYVATCIYGSYNCPEVWTLRRYRDDILSASWFGRQFIRFYYKVSPKVVELIGHKKWFNRLLKPIFDKFILKLQKSGIENSIYFD